MGLFGAVEAASQEMPSFSQYAPTHERYSAVGLASWYGSEFRGRATADGEIFGVGSLSAAHRTMPLPSYARVTNLGNGRSIVVRVNDRGPFVRGRILDVSARVATLLDFNRRGVAKVRLDYIGKAPPAGSDEPALLASLQTRGAPTVESASLTARAVSVERRAVVERPSAPEPRSPYGELVADVFGEPSAPRAPIETLTFVARAVDRPQPAEPRSPYGELVAYPFSEQAALRWDAAPPP
jgi:rare lipoprotein A